MYLKLLKLAMKQKREHLCYYILDELLSELEPKTA